MTEQKLTADKAKSWWWIVITTVFSVVLIYGITLQLRQLSKTMEAEKEAIALIFSLEGFDTPAKIQLKELSRLSPNEKFVFEGPSETLVQFIGPSRLEEGKSVVVKKGNLKTPFGKIPKGAEEILFFGPSGEKVKIFKKPLS